MRGEFALEASEVVVDYSTAEGIVRSLDGATIQIESGAITAVVGESGSGKTTLGLAVGRLLPANARYTGGDLRVLGRAVLTTSDSHVRSLRRDALGYVFQNPVASLNPTLRIGRQMALASGDGLTRQRLGDALADVGLADVDRVLQAFPHELSGGMAQRVGIAMALMSDPRLLVADEPTAAVDATQRARILELLVERCQDGGRTLLLLTHDLRNVAHWCTHVAVMYAGRVVEYGPAADVLREPHHPYTRALVAAMPGDERLGQRLRAIPGVPPVLRAQSPGCAFSARCTSALPRCPETRPTYSSIGGRSLCCLLYEDQRALLNDSTSDAACTHGNDDREHRSGPDRFVREARA